jgi:hypothetical protein
MKTEQGPAGDAATVAGAELMKPMWTYYSAMFRLARLVRRAEGEVPVGIGSGGDLYVRLNALVDGPIPARGTEHREWLILRDFRQMLTRAAVNLGYSVPLISPTDVRVALPDDPQVPPPPEVRLLAELEARRAEATAAPTQAAPVEAPAAAVAVAVPEHEAAGATVGVEVEAADPFAA